MNSSITAVPIETKQHISLIFSIEDKVGGLQEALEIIKTQKLNMTRIESRPSKDHKWDYDFFVDFQDATATQASQLTQLLVDRGFGVTLLDTEKHYPSTAASTMKNVPWFPRKISDLDAFAHKVFEYGAELSADHPGFTDPVYRERRKMIVDIAKNYKHGDLIPRIEYTKEELATWKIVYNELKKLYATNACRQHNYVFPLLEVNCGYGPDNIPQLEDISRFLKECTGWTIRPVQGLLSARDFLNGLAFRVFHSTQYIRHHSRPLYTPEPDVCHEVLGHVPLFADPDFADFSQEIGLASLGASDEDIKRLVTVYWYTVEFGICEEDGKLKAFGAGLLSSFGELKYCLGGDDEKPAYKPFDPFEVAKIDEYPITRYQPFYYVATSFQRAKEQIIQWTKSLDRGFHVRYNPYTQSVEILDTTEKVVRVIKDIQAELSTIQTALMDLRTVPKKH